ncbi:prostaglandin E2 receptor EP4 subtype-like [Amblyraja radiata]|uniref:prostaglandin E2 receptor EP4 subtype-like n=1 Tax=Amblyraja radiata TaxID=386614 RepID=UPI001402B51A|nr:prostaglandin E2 receptor EP4 subtype-like [Amblyraja radiata]
MNGSVPGGAGDGAGAAGAGSGKKLLIPALMFVCGVVGNGTALCVLWRGRREGRERTFYTLVCGLALTDLLGTCLVSPVTIVTYVRGSWLQKEGALCNYACFMLLFFGSAGLSIICAMSLERYLAINHAYFYSQHMDRRAAAATLLAIYGANTLLCALPSCGLGRAALQYPGTWCFIDWRSRDAAQAAFSYMYAGFNSFLVALTLACNVLVCGALVRMHRRLLRRTSLGSGRRQPGTGAPTEARRPASLRPLAAAEIQMVILLIATSAVVLICSSPLVVRVFINQLYQPQEVKEYDRNPDLWAIRIAAINPILDPWIYILLRKSLMRRVLRQARCLLHCSLPPGNARPSTPLRRLPPPHFPLPLTIPCKVTPPPPTAPPLSTRGALPGLGSHPSAGGKEGSPDCPLKVPFTQDCGGEAEKCI